VLAAIDHIFKWGCTVRRSPDAVSSEIVLVLVVVLVLDSRRCNRSPHGYELPSDQSGARISRDAGKKVSRTRTTTSTRTI